MSDELKRAAAEASVAYIKPGMALGLGTGSTAAHMVRALGEKVRAGLKLAGTVATSEATAALARAEGIEVLSLDALPALDLTIDGADEIGPGLALIKGGGGALLREKIVASASRALLVIADHTKRVDALGDFGLPVEVIPFALEPVRRKISALGGRATLRLAGAAPFTTDEGNRILDVDFGKIEAPAPLAVALSQIPGVVEHGLFIELARAAILAGPSGLETLGDPQI